MEINTVLTDLYNQESKLKNICASHLLDSCKTLSTGRLDTSLRSTNNRYLRINEASQGGSKYWQVSTTQKRFGGIDNCKYYVMFNQNATDKQISDYISDGIPSVSKTEDAPIKVYKKLWTKHGPHFVQTSSGLQSTSLVNNVIEQTKKAYTHNIGLTSEI